MIKISNNSPKRRAVFSCSLLNPCHRGNLVRPARSVCDFEFDFWDLFEFWDLLFGIYTYYAINTITIPQIIRRVLLIA